MIEDCSKKKKKNLNTKEFVASYHARNSAAVKWATSCWSRFFSRQVLLCILVWGFFFFFLQSPFLTLCGRFCTVVMNTNLHTHLCEKVYLYTPKSQNITATPVLYKWQPMARKAWCNFQCFSTDASLVAVCRGLCTNWGLFLIDESVQPATILDSPFLAFPLVPVQRSSEVMYSQAPVLLIQCFILQCGGQVVIDLPGVTTCLWCTFPAVSSTLAISFLVPKSSAWAFCCSISAIPGSDLWQSICNGETGCSLMSGWWFCCWS